MKKHPQTRLFKAALFFYFIPRSGLSQINKPLMRPFASYCCGSDVDCCSIFFSQTVNLSFYLHTFSGACQDKRIIMNIWLLLIIVLWNVVVLGFKIVTANDSVNMF